jgi:hypothetical protein
MKKTKFKEEQIVAILKEQSPVFNPGRGSKQRSSP